MAPNNRFFLTLLQYYSRNHAKQGFVLPTLIGLGLIMTVVGLTMIGRSSNDQQTATLQKQSAQAQAIAETGVTRTLAELQGTELLETDYVPSDPNNLWNTYTGPCGNSIPGVGNEANLDSGGSYEVIDYDFTSGTPDQGTLTIEGQTPQGQEDNAARSQVQVQVDIQGGPNSFPAVYTEQNADMGNNDIIEVANNEEKTTANLICKDCTVPNSCQNDQPTESEKRSAVGINNQNAKIKGNIYIKQKAKLPSLPDIPTDYTNDDDNPNYDDSDGLDITGNTVLPQVGDSPVEVNGNQAYHYKVEKIDLGGSDTLTINTTQSAIDDYNYDTGNNESPPPAAPVYLYVTGDIDMGGDSQLAHTGPAGDFRIFGKLPENADESTFEQTFTIRGAATTTNLLIYSPYANVGINGGSGDPVIQGAVWAKSWGASNSNVANLGVPEDIQNQLQDLVGPGVNIGRLSTSSPTNWQKQSANSE